MKFEKSSPGPGGRENGPLAAKMETQDDPGISVKIEVEDFQVEEKVEISTIEKENAENRRKSVTCPICDKTFSRKDNLKQHLRRYSRTPEMITIHHELEQASEDKNKDKPKSFECPICDKTFSRKIYLRQHLERYSQTSEMIKIHLDLKNQTYEDKPK